MATTPDPAVAARLRTWQGVTLGTLFVGYAGYYICRSNLSVATPLLLDEYRDLGLTKGMIGDVASFGVLFYAIGKSINGVAVEYLGGRRLFLAGMLLSVICTVLFALSPAVAGSFTWLGLPVAILGPFFVVWAMNRFVQSMGWGGLVQVTARWFSASRMASVMGFLSMSYLLGDAMARLALGGVVSAGADWRGLFYFAAAALGAIFLVGVIALKSRPSVLGLPEPPPPPDNVYGHNTGDDRVSLIGLLLPLFTSSTFWLVCFMNVGLTLIRETFNLWNPTYLKEAARLDPGTAGMASLVFPLVGAGSSLLAGFAVDAARGRYGLVVVPSLVCLAVVLMGMAWFPVGDLPDGVRPVVAMGMISCVAMFLLAPYTFCSGVLAVRLGGQRGGSTAAGFIDTAGYLGATLAGSGIGRVAERYGWGAAFGSLAGVTLVTLLVATVYTIRSHRSTPKTQGK